MRNRYHRINRNLNMNFIKEKKINKYIMIAALFLSFGYSGFYYMRGALALLTASGTFVFNDVWAFLFAAVIGGGVYELVTMFLARGSAARLNNRGADMQYALRFFYIPANLLSGVLKTLYFYFPYLFSYGEIFFDFFFVLIFYILYIVFCCKAYFKKEEYGRVVMFLGSSFLCVYGFIAVVALLSGVLA